MKTDSQREWGRAQVEIASEVVAKSQRVIELDDEELSGGAAAMASISVFEFPFLLPATGAPPTAIATTTTEGFLSLSLSGGPL